MKIFNKLTALTLVLIMAFTCLASCGLFDSVESYKATVRTSFTSNDAAMADAIAALEKSEVTLYVYGENLMVVSETSLGDIKLDRAYTVADGTLYNNTTLNAEGKTVTEKEKAPFDQGKRDELLLKVGAGASLDTDDFNNVTESAEGKATAYTCSGIKDDAKASLIAVFAAKFASLNAGVSMLDAEYYVEKQDGKPVNYILNARFIITINSETYGVNMTIECDYDYNSKVKVTAPDGTDAYTEVACEDIIG
ncbi:MAG: hypothetical protein J6K85_02235 [Clostridia bacterium]|nr:hypothetical protein [Clostridia bacterium]